MGGRSLSLQYKEKLLADAFRDNYLLHFENSIILEALLLFPCLPFILTAATLSLKSLAELYFGSITSKPVLTIYSEYPFIPKYAPEKASSQLS